jgi:hypothetical protein
MGRTNHFQYMAFFLTSQPHHKQTLQAGGGMMSQPPKLLDQVTSPLLPGTRPSLPSL